MDLRELTDLIAIRQYVVNATGSFTIDRATLNAMNGTLLLIDKKIISILTGSNFKNYIDYGNLPKAIEEVVKLNDIKNGINKT